LRNTGNRSGSVTDDLLTAHGLRFTADGLRLTAYGFPLRHPEAEGRSRKPVKHKDPVNRCRFPGLNVSKNQTAREPLTDPRAGKCRRRSQSHTRRRPGPASPDMRGHAQQQHGAKQQGIVVKVPQHGGPRTPPCGVRGAGRKNTCPSDVRVQCPGSEGPVCPGSNVQRSYPKLEVLSSKFEVGLAPAPRLTVPAALRHSLSNVADCAVWRVPLLSVYHGPGFAVRGSTLR